MTFPEFRRRDGLVVRKAIEMVEGGATYAEAARIATVDHRTVREWMRKHKQDPEWLDRRINATYVKPGVTHGTNTSYQRGCRCEQCREAGSSARARHERYKHFNGSRRVGATGSRRRVQALYAMAWTARHIAEAAQLSPHTVHEIAKPKCKSVYRETANAIRVAYDQLSMTTGPSPVTSGQARSRGYAPPLAWDDDTIDDPAAKPNTGHANGHGKGSGRRGFVSRLPDPDILAAEVNRSGRRVVAERYGSTPDAVWTRLNRAGYRASHTGDIHELPIYRKAAA